MLIQRTESAVSFRVKGSITEIETIAVGTEIRELRRLRRVYGGGRWRKRKGICTIELPSGRMKRAEVHWYEAHGIGKREMKIKRFL